MIKVFSFVLISIEGISKTQATDIISNESTISIGDYGILSNQPLDITNYNLGTIYGNSTTGYGFGVENSASINLNNSSINSIYGISSIDAAWGIRSQDTITVNNTSGGSIYGSGDADGYGIASPNLITINNSGSGSIYGESSRQNAYGLSFGDMNVINSGSGSIYGTTLSGSSYGIYSLGNSTIENSGSSSIYAATAFGSAFGIYSAGNITLENLESAKIYGETTSGPVWGILSNGNIQINNSIDAKISASTNGGDAIGIQTSSNLKILNDGEISSRSIGVTNSIAIQTSDQTDFELLNNGIIEATGDNNVIAIGNFGTSEQLINNNQIIAMSNFVSNGILNSNGTIQSLINYGTINASGVSNSYGISNYTDSTAFGEYPVDGYINNLTNAGNILSSAGWSIGNSALITTITNTGSIIGAGGIGNDGYILEINNSNNVEATGEPLPGEGAAIGSVGTIGSISNTGNIISAKQYGIGNGGTITTITNSGIISAAEGDGIANRIGTFYGTQFAGNITSITNQINGEIFGYLDGISNSNQIGSIENSGSIKGAEDSGIFNAGSLTTVLNNSSILGGKYGILNYSGSLYNIDYVGSIDTLVNKGSISGGIVDVLNYDSSILNFTNGQGGNGSVAKKTALTYSGILPNSYYIYVTSKTQYGQVAFSNVTGSMNFDIASGSVLSTGTYNNILSGIDNTNLANLNGSFGARSWSLVNAGSKYNLVISAPNSQDMSTIPSNQDGSKTIPSGTSAKIAQLTASDNITIGSGGSLDDSGTSDPVKVSGGSLKVESGGTVTTAIKVQGGSVEIASGGTLISEDTVTVTDGSLTVGGTINAPIALSTGRKFSLADLVSFSPVFTLSSGGTVIGPLTIDAAGARVNGTIQGSVTIGDGAALRGTGIITGESTVSSGGILAPGNSPGIMTFTASLTQGSGSTLSLDIDGTNAGTGAGYYSQVLVTGSGNTYTIGSGATIQPNLRNITGSANNTYTPSIGDVFTVVSADGGVSGTFSTLTQPSSGLTAGTRFIDLYTSTEVQLKVVKSGYSTIGASTNSNLGNVGSAIDSVSGMTGDRSTLMNAIFALSSDTDSTTALKQLSGDIQTVSPIAAVQSSRAIGAVVDNRMASVRGGTTDTSLNSELFDFSSLTTTGTSQVVGSIIKGFSLATDQEFSDSKPWMKVLTRSSSGSSDSNGLGVNSSTVGAAAGIDYTLNSKGFVGAAIGVASNSITNGQTVTTTSASLYGSHDIGSAYIASRLSFALDDYRGSRSIEFGTISRTTSANTYGYQLGGAIELGNRYRFGAVSGELYGSFESGWLQRAAYTESGADSANLTMDELKAQTSTSKLGVRLTSILNQTDSGNIQAFSDIAWGHDFGDTSIIANHTLMGSSFSLEGPNVGRDSAEIGFGIASENKKGYRFFAKYAGEFRKMEVSRTAELGVTMIW